MSSALWIELDGAANVRDIGGLPTADGRTVRPGRLIRAASLQNLTEHDVRLLVDDLRVRSIVDLRTGVEVRAEGPGPMTREKQVRVEHLSLFPEPEVDTATPDDGPVVLPWQNRDDTLGEDEGQRRGTSAVYLRYLDERADSILAALRTIAGSDGATIVHCAAGKDRTGTVVAIALAEVGVTPEAITEDYARSGERIEAILGNLQRSPTYQNDAADWDLDRHRPRAVTMERLLAALDEIHCGAPAWLRAHGWTDSDAAALRRKLLE